MTKDKMRAELEDLKSRKFNLEMCDHWDFDDYERIGILNAEIRELERRLEFHELLRNLRTNGRM